MRHYHSMRVILVIDAVVTTIGVKVDVGVEEAEVEVGVEEAEAEVDVVGLIIIVISIIKIHGKKLGEC